MLNIVLNTVKLFIGIIFTIFIMCLIITITFSLAFWETNLLVNFYKTLINIEMYEIRFFGIFLMISLIISIIRNKA